MKRVAIITGITSFLGKELAKYLISKKFLVFGITRPNSNRKSQLSEIKGLNVIELDFERIEYKNIDDYPNTDGKKFIEDIISKKCDITFIHFAWDGTTDRENFARQMLNIDDSMKVLSLAKLLKAKRFIFAGSQAEMSESAYGLAKKQFSDVASSYLKNDSMKFIHLRIFSIYGENDRENSLVKQLVKCFKEKKDIELSSCNYYWNFLHVDDFVLIIYKLIIKNAKTGVYDIASDEDRLLKDYCEIAKRAYNSDIKLLFGARANKKEKFAMPNIDSTIKVVGKIKFIPFMEGVLKV